MNCSTCDKTVDTKRLPRGWKNHNGTNYCGKCWAQKYVLRAITIPVVRPLGEGIGWPELREALNKSWSLTTAAVNWINSELYVRDTKREPSQEKIGKFPKIYLYPELRQRFPELPSHVCSALENSAKAKYIKRRYDIIWTCDSSVPNARYPQPAIAPNQAWRPSYETAGKDSGDAVPCVSVTLLGGQRFLLQLRGGVEFRRQLGDFRRLVDGTAIRGELALIRQRVGGTDNRNGVTGRDSGGQQFRSRVMVKMVGWFPRAPARELAGTLTVRTDTDCFAIALDQEASKLRVWNADHVRRWISEHTRRLNRWSDDQKAEQRPVASFQSRREYDALKFRRRIDSFIKETCAQIAGVAQRRKFATVRLDDTERAYLPKFDWSGFRTRLAAKLNDCGIILELASGEDVPKQLEPLAATEGEA